MPNHTLLRAGRTRSIIITLLTGLGLALGSAHARLQPETAPAATPPPAKPGLTHPAPDQPAAPTAPSTPDKPANPNSPAPTPPKAPGGGVPGLAEIKAMMEEQSKPAEEHQVLDALVGNFSAAGKLSFGPGMPELKSTGKATGAWMLGKRFVKVETTVGQGEQELHSEGLTIYGYDTRMQKYTVTAFDTFGTYSVNASGDYDKAANELKLIGEVVENGRKMNFRWNVKLGEKTCTTRIQMELAPDQWLTVSELTYTKE